MMTEKTIAKGDLRKLQLLQLDILVDIDRLCKKLNLKYYIIAGTLLGAIRHQGFIPWDSDIDIAMYRKDYDFLIKEGNNHINSKYFIQSDYSDNKHQGSFAKVRINNTIYIEKNNKINGKNRGIYLDIFPLDDIKMFPSKLQYYNAKFLKLLQRVKAFRNGKVFSTTMTRTFVGIIASSLTIMVPKQYINRFIESSMRKGNNKRFKYVTNYCSKYGIIKQFMSKEVYGDPVELEFEGMKFWAPRKYIYWLERIYGDFMAVPEVIPDLNFISAKYNYDLGPYK